MLGIVTVGQSPRPDLERAFEAHSRGVRVVVRGALDGLGASEIDALAAGSSEYPLLVRLAGGLTREVPIEAIHPLVERRARELAGLGARVVVVACAGGFPDVVCEVPVLLPGRILPAVAGAIAPDRRIGVVAPIRAQVPAATRKWTADGFDPVVSWASPSAPDEIEAAGRLMRESAAGLVVLDCFGFDDDGARAFAALAGKPVLAAQPVTARLAGAIVRG